MRKKRAKMLMALAVDIMKSMDRPLGQGYRKYHREKNHIVWDYLNDGDGLPKNGPDGKPVLAPKKVDGTMRTAYVLRAIYKKLKVEWVQTKGEGELFKSINKMEGEINDI